MLSALMVFYRDFRHVVPFLTQILMYLHSGDLSGERAAGAVSLAVGPESDVRDRHRISLGHSRHAVELSDSGYLSRSAVLTFLVAVFYFRRTERRFADFA